jgi:CheY-like chemotaxis protein/DNA-directed RNA polymerase specialized sigma24 family protein
MIRSETIAPHLPFLRRYARALTGSQTSGDAYVRACLETLVADPMAIPDDIRPRVGLYKLFHTIWNGTGRKLEARSGSEPGEVIAARLQRLGSEQRQTLLLSALEGFSDEEVGKILNKSEAEVQALLKNAVETMAGATATDVLVIEDESIIALDICSIVEGLGHRVIKVAATRKQAVEAAREHRPGLVLADIQLADHSSGIDAVNDILADASVPVVFITAYPDRLLTGERPEPTFLISKPFSHEEVRATVSQALLMHDATGSAV